jgi:hypothetical protein
MPRWFAKRRKECPRCESSVVHRSERKGFQERFVHPFVFVWPYVCRNCNIRFLGFHSRYTRPYKKPNFRLAKVSASSSQ